MERLQSAIAKARAARNARPVSDTPPDRPDATAAQKADMARVRREAEVVPADMPIIPPEPVDESVEAAWSALPEAKISEKLLIENRIISTGGRSVDAMEFDRLRTRILQRMQAKGWRRLAITSPGPGCGKSTISLNLGFGLARQDSARVMMVELDMRRPSIARILGIKSDYDVSRVLAGEARPEEHMIRARHNLAIGITRHVSESAELLHSNTTAAVLDEMQARYQPSVMLFDMPPFRVSDDVISFAGKVDCVLIVAAAGQTSIEELDDCERELAAQTEVLGVVLNKCRYQDQEGQYYYYG